MAVDGLLIVLDAGGTSVGSQQWPPVRCGAVRDVCRPRMVVKNGWGVFQYCRWCTVVGLYSETSAASRHAGGQLRQGRAEQTRCCLK